MVVSKTTISELFARTRHFARSVINGFAAFGLSLAGIGDCLSLAQPNLAWQVLNLFSQPRRPMMATTADEAWRLLGERSEAQKETDRGLQETKQLLKQPAEADERRNQQLNEQLGQLGNRLGEFVERQVRPAVVRLFQERGIEVHESMVRFQSSRGMRVSRLTCWWSIPPMPLGLR
jgi:methionyl-tRNA synthetase